MNIFTFFLAENRCSEDSAFRDSRCRGRSQLQSCPSTNFSHLSVVQLSLTKQKTFPTHPQRYSTEKGTPPPHLFVYLAQPFQIKHLTNNHNPTCREKPLMEYRTLSIETPIFVIHPLSPLSFALLISSRWNASRQWLGQNGLLNCQSRNIRTPALISYGAGNRGRCNEVQHV